MDRIAVRNAITSARLIADKIVWAQRQEATRADELLREAKALSRILTAQLGTLIQQTPEQEVVAWLQQVIQQARSNFGGK